MVMMKTITFTIGVMGLSCFAVAAQAGEDPEPVKQLEIQALPIDSYARLATEIKLEGTRPDVSRATSFSRAFLSYRILFEPEYANRITPLYLYDVAHFKQDRYVRAVRSAVLQNASVALATPTEDAGSAFAMVALIDSKESIVDKLRSLASQRQTSPLSEERVLVAFDVKLEGVAYDSQYFCRSTQCGFANSYFARRSDVRMAISQ